jgi:arsenate reductase
MAEGFARHYGSDLLEIYSAGTHPASYISPDTIKVMAEKGIDVSSHYPKYIDEIPNGVDILITMGCEVECPYIPAKLREDWGIDDPIGKPVEEYRRIRDIIEGKVKNMISYIKNNKEKFFE